MTDFTSLLKKWLGQLKRQPRWKTILFALAGGLTLLVLATGGASSAAGSDGDVSSPLFLVGVAVKLGGVLMLIVGGAVLLRKWQVKLPGRKDLRQVTVLESVRLSPRQALHLVKAGDRQLLIGATDQGITLISVVDAVEQPLPEEQAAPADEFPAVLHSLTAQSTPVSAFELHHS